VSFSLENILLPSFGQSRRTLPQARRRGLLLARSAATFLAAFTARATSGGLFTQFLVLFEFVLREDRFDFGESLLTEFLHPLATLFGGEIGVLA
jgi:hypothetical protein